MVFRQSQRRSARKGNVAVLVAFLLTALLGMVGFAIDGGALLSEKRHAQTIADSAAMAAACVIYENYPAVMTYDSVTKKKQFNLSSTMKAAATTAALDVAAANGYLNDTSEGSPVAGSSSITVRFPGNFIKTDSIYNNTTKDSTSFEGKLCEGCVEVTIMYYQQRYFSTIWSTEAMGIKVRAVAKGAWRQPNNGVIVLDYDPEKGALNTKGGGAVTVTGGSFIVNSSHPTAAVEVTGGGTITAPEFDVTGGVTLSGGGASVTTSPTPNQVFSGVHPTPDPLAYLPIPSQPANGTITTSGDYIYLTPGYYPNGSIPNITNGKTVVMNGDGIYYLDTSLVVPSGSVVMGNTGNGGVNTSGVMIYQNEGTFNVNGNGSGGIQLTGLQGDTPYAGMVFWQPKGNTDNPDGNTNDIGIQGNGNVNIKGTFYAPDALITVTGNGTTATGNDYGSQFVSDHFKVAGNGNIDIKFNGPDAVATRILCLVE